MVDTYDAYLRYGGMLLSFAGIVKNNFFTQAFIGTPLGLSTDFTTTQGLLTSMS